MPEHDIETIESIDDAFAEFRVSTTPRLEPAGLGPVRATARRRRQVRMATLSVVAAVLVLVPLGAVLGHHPVGHPVGGPTPTPSGTHWRYPAPSPHPLSSNDFTTCGLSVTPGPGPKSLTVNRLCNTTLDLPPVPASDRCPHGPVAFVQGAARPPFAPGVTVFVLVEVSYADVDHDGVTDPIARFVCGVDGHLYTQVVVFTRGPDGAIRTLGRVVGAGSPATPGVDMAEGTADGLIRVGVTNQLDYDPVDEVIQLRTYAWTGAGFTQVAGSTSFLADRAAADLTVTASAIVFDKPDRRTRVGHLVVTVHNNGRRPAGSLSIHMYATYHRFSGACAPYGGPDLSCPIGTLAPGATWQATITVNVEQNTLDGLGAPHWSEGFAPIQLKIGDQLYTEVDDLTATYR